MHQLKREIEIPISLEEAWDFFSSPKNLSVITPPRMGFIIKSELPERMYSGQIITYTVKPLLSIPMTWVTEIKHVEDQHMFVDEQRFGPYALWHHKHFFKAIPGGVHMTDIVDYKIPLGILGKMMNPILVAPQLKDIFDFRTQKLEELFGTMASPKKTHT